MKHHGAIPLFTGAALLACACCNPPAAPGPFLVAAGYLSNGTNDVAASWDDDLSNPDAPVLTSLFESANARATGLCVAGTDVYVAGYFTNPAGNLAAGCWKNGTLTVLYSDTSGTFDARAVSVCVAGTDVYVAGYIDEGARQPGYWKNDAWVPLGAIDGEASDIVVSDSIVYVAGYEMPASEPRACYWRNGVPVALDDARYSQALGISVDGTDVYVAGYYLDGGLAAALWHDDAAGLTTLASGGAKAYDVTVNGTDVIVAGYSTNASSRSVACCWTNGSAAALYDSPANNAQALGVIAAGADVYVTGYVNEGTKTACYWKNGARVGISTASSECYAPGLRD